MPWRRHPCRSPDEAAEQGFDVPWPPPVRWADQDGFYSVAPFAYFALRKRDRVHDHSDHLSRGKNLNRLYAGPSHFKLDPVVLEVGKQLPIRIIDRQLDVNAIFGKHEHRVRGIQNVDLEGRVPEILRQCLLWPQEGN